MSSSSSSSTALASDESKEILAKRRRLIEAFHNFPPALRWRLERWWKENLPYESDVPPLEHPHEYRTRVINAMSDAEIRAFYKAMLSIKERHYEDFFRTEARMQESARQTILYLQQSPEYSPSSSRTSATQQQPTVLAATPPPRAIPRPAELASPPSALAAQQQEFLRKIRDALPTSFIALRPPPMLPAEIMQQAKELNVDYRRVFYTHDGAADGEGATQLVAMSLGMQADDANREVGWEQHERTTQYFAVTEGSGTLVLAETEGGRNKREVRVSAALESKWWVTPGTWHNVVVAPGEAIKLLVEYHPPHHPPGTRDRTRVDAEHREAAAKAAGAVCVVCGAVARARGPTAAFCSAVHAMKYKAELTKRLMQPYSYPAV